MRSTPTQGHAGRTLSGRRVTAGLHRRALSLETSASCAARSRSAREALDGLHVSGRRWRGEGCSIGHVAVLARLHPGCRARTLRWVGVRVVLKIAPRPTVLVHASPRTRSTCALRHPPKRAPALARRARGKVVTCRCALQLGWLAACTTAKLLAFSRPERASAITARCLSDTIAVIEIGERGSRCSGWRWSASRAPFQGARRAGRVKKAYGLAPRPPLRAHVRDGSAVFVDAAHDGAHLALILASA